jgi:hypothetical protein
VTLLPVRISPEIRELKQGNIMKKTLATLALAAPFGALAAFDMPALNLNSKIGFDSEYVNHGRKEGQENMTASAEIAMPVMGGQAYAGASTVLMIEDSERYMLFDPRGSNGPEVLELTSIGSFAEVSPYLGYSRDIAGLFTADIGYVAHLYTNLSALSVLGVDLKRNTNELYVGGAVNTLFSPKGYIAYDFDRDEFDITVSGTYSYDLGNFGMNHFAVEGKVLLGFDHVRRPYGIKGFFATNLDESKNYFYFGLGADLVFKYNEQASIRGGLHLSGNSVSKGNWANRGVLNDKESHKNLVWFSSAVEFSF